MPLAIRGHFWWCVCSGIFQMLSEDAWKWINQWGHLGRGSQDERWFHAGRSVDSSRLTDLITPFITKMKKRTLLQSAHKSIKCLFIYFAFCRQKVSVQLMSFSRMFVTCVCLVVLTLIWTDTSDHLFCIFFYYWDIWYPLCAHWILP